MSIYSKIIDIQKLNAAWDRVRKNKPAAGVDGVTYDEFENNRRENIHQLNLELREHEYQSLPVKQVVLYKGEKARPIALYSMRDKVVQQAVAQELNKIYDSKFSTQTYAYRSDKSAIVAIEEIHNAIMTGSYGYYIKLDIHDFFGSIDWNLLKNKLAGITEEDVLFLIKENCCGLSIDEKTGELCEKRRGIYQGSGIAPVLSNIYLMDFDTYMTGIESIHFIRYSDDMIVLGNSKDGMMSLLQEMVKRLEKMGLKINDKKSGIGAISDGVDFLGYHFDDKGKAIPQKAEIGLIERLEGVWLCSGDLPMEDKIKKVLEIVGGWEQYFRGAREVGSVFEYVAIVFSNAADIGELINLRLGQINIYRDITAYLSSVWNAKNRADMELLEYEQYYMSKLCVSRAETGEKMQYEKISGASENEDVHISELLASYRNYFSSENESTALEIMQAYIDCGDYAAAQMWHEQSEKLRKDQDKRFDMLLTLNKNSDDDLIFKSETVSKFLRLFAGREDLFVREGMDVHGHRKSENVCLPLTESQIKDHLMGKETLGTYIQRANATVRFLIFDVDVSKKVLISYGRDNDEFKTCLQKALDTVYEMKKMLAGFGMPTYVEYSGCRGYHLWMFFSEWIQTRYAIMLTEAVLQRISPDNDVTIECFPNKTRIKDGRYGQCIKLPYGIHIKTGERSFFIDDDGPIWTIDKFIDSVAHVSLNDVKRVLAQKSGGAEGVSVREIETDLSVFGQLEANVTEVLNKCNLMRYLCLKAKNTGYLSHFERMSILYVFGHMGEAGKEFVHKIMSYTLNYQYNTTDRFINKLPEKPISCNKLREQYKKLTAELGCGCSFKRSGKCYPSPVLHAITGSADVVSDVTLPLSRTLTKNKEQEVLSAINVHAKAQDLAKRILDLKKQQRALEKSIGKIEKELCTVFDQQGCDCLEIEMGMLVRRKKENGYEWLIEI